MNTPSNYLTSLAADINAALTRDETNRADWVAIKLDLCKLFADARSRFKDDISFGKWRLKEIGNAINDKDCTGYVKMGADLARAKIVFDKTTRSSIQLIYANEFPDRSANASGPAQKPGKTTRQPRKPGVKQAQRSVNATDDTWNEFKAKAEASGRVVADVLGEMVEKAVDPDLPPAEDVLGKTALDKLAAYQRKLNKDFEWVVRQKVIAELEEARKRLKKVWEENLGKLERALNRRGKVFTKTEYNVLLRVVHPDTGANASDDQRAEAFRLLNDRKVKLLDEEDFSTAAARAPMARTLAEMEAARAKVKAENSERAKKAAATRKAKQEQSA